MTRKPKPNAMLGVGIAIGTALGIAFHNLGLYLALGVAAGLGMRAAVRKGLDR